MLDFSGADVESIESALDSRFSRSWRRLKDDDLASCRKLKSRAGWRIELQPGDVLCPDVDHLLVVIDDLFPKSQPRVLAPQVSEPNWPHVEEQGLLCLSRTRISADPGERVAQHFQWALDLLNYDEAARRQEFQREVGTYWGRNTKAPPLMFTSLVAPHGPSREIHYYTDLSKKRLVLADRKDELNAWLNNTGWARGKDDIKRTSFAWLDEPPVPSEYPVKCVDVLSLLPEELRTAVLKSCDQTPILLGMPTPAGPVLLGLTLGAVSVKEATKGFRNIHRVPAHRLEQIGMSRAVRRYQVWRADGAYVHGRDHDVGYPALANKTVGIVGCGALGGSIARLLAQAGVGRFLLVDDDELGTQNIARHVLGHSLVGLYKTQALRKRLERDFPHLKGVAAFESRIERLSENAWAKLATCDLIISAGVDFVGDSALDEWRLRLGGAPTHLCTWVEPYALVGHAVAVFGTDSLLEIFDEDGRPFIALTTWPESSQTMIPEAGCGNLFQPHGAVDLQATVNLAGCLALDVLRKIVCSSHRRTWQGDREEVEDHGGVPLEGFGENRIELRHPWPGVPMRPEAGT